MSTSPEAPRGRILVADDEVPLQRGFARLLRGAGYEVDTACNGEEATQLLRKYDFDVILSDIFMPDMDGVALLRWVREQARDIPVILITANPEIETAMEAVEHGAVRYLVKPVESNDLLKATEYALRLRRLSTIERRVMDYHGIGERAGLDSGFKRALATLTVAYQPIVRWTGQEVFGFEALVRSSEPTLPHPDALFSAAELLGRLPDIGRALRARIAADIQASPEPLTVFVNIHPQDLVDEQLFADDAPLSLQADQVVLEVTERASLDIVGDLSKRVARLREMGFRIALDDLGSGYSGLTSFAILEPEVVKLDMSLVRNIHEEPIKQKLARSLLSLCQEMGVMVVAEGVETPEERDALLELGCDLLQGFLFAVPGHAFPGVRWG